MPGLFPLFLKLEGRPCLVVGAGPVAAQKIPGLLHAGADVRVVSPEACEEVRRMADAGSLRWNRKAFDSGDLDGVTLVIASTGDRALNAAIFRLATERGILCNAVDEPENCSFYYPSVVRRGDLQIAISTNGKSPALAQRLRRELDRQLPAAYGSWIDWLGRVRTRLFRRAIEPRRRTALLHRVASAIAYERFLTRSKGAGR